MEKTSYKYKLIHNTLRVSPGVFNISALCKLAGVSRSGYYAWIKASPVHEAREAQDRDDFEIILTIYKKRGYAKGDRGIYMGLLHRNPPVVMNIKKIRRLMKKYNLFCPIRKANPYRRMAKAIKKSNYADNLLQREFECYGPQYVLLTDITYIPYNGAFAYLSTILDAYTKQILACVLSASLEVDFVKETVEILIRDYGISLHKVHTITNKYLNIVVPTFNKRQEDGLLGVFVDEHVNYFTIHTLSVLMNSCGFKLVNWEQDTKNKRNWGSPIMSLWKKKDEPEILEIDADMANNDKKMVDNYFINDEIKFKTIKKKLDGIDEHIKIGLLNVRGHAAKKLFAAYDFQKKNVVKVYDDDSGRYNDIVLGKKVEPFQMGHIENGIVELLIICNSFSQEWIYEDYCKLGIADKVICLF